VELGLLAHQADTATPGFEPATAWTTTTSGSVVACHPSNFGRSGRLSDRTSGRWAGRLTEKGPHKGGERLWQCRDWESFTLAWKRGGNFPEPHDLEMAIGERFKELAGGLPFANVGLY
jgi:hypothetical protein